MRIAFLGDLGFFGRYSYDVSSFKKFENLITYLEGFDYVIANLETPLTNGSNKTIGKSINLKSDPINVNLLKLLNINIVNLSNNHIFDYGIEGFNDTIYNLTKNNIGYFGVSNDRYVISKGNNKISLRGYCCYTTNPLKIDAKKDPYLVSLSDINIRNNFNQDKLENMFPIISCHFGTEHVNYPLNEHLKMFRYLSKDYKYFLYGHHPHVLQGIESINNSVLTYSLGNLCFDDIYKNNEKLPRVKMTDNNMYSMVVDINIESNNILNYGYKGFKWENDILKFSCEVDNFIEKISNDLLLNYEEINSIRKQSSMNISNYTKKGLKWVLKRMNFNSMLIWVRMKKNDKKFRNLYKNF